MAGRPAAACALLACCLAGSGAAVARERLLRCIDQRDGLRVAEINQLAQDARGFIWIGNASGLYRYDGQELRLWLAGGGEFEPRQIVPGPAGELLVVTRRGTLFGATASGAAAVLDDGGHPITGVKEALFDARGGLWLLNSSGILHREGDAAWESIALAGVGEERPRLLRRDPVGQLFIATRAGIWSWRPATGAVREWAVRDVADFEIEPGGAIAAVMTDDEAGRLLLRRGGVTEELLALPGSRAISLVRRGTTYWVSFDNCLAAVRPGQPPELIREDTGLPPGGPLLIDAEECLWKGSFRGLFMFPEPDTFALTVRDGLNSAPRRFFSTPGETWLDGWGGLGRLTLGAAGAAPEIEPQLPGTTPVCADARGTLWAAGHDRIAERRGRGWTGHPWPGLKWANACSGSSTGSVWLATAEQLVLVGGAEPRPRAVRAPPWSEGNESGFAGAVEDGRGTLWVSRDEEVCHAPARAVAAGVDAVWACERLPGCLAIHELVELPTGSLWAATRTCGVMRRRDGRWESIPGSRELASAAISRISVSPSGGAWVTGFGIIVRVADRPDLPQGWEIVEQPSLWMGLPSADVGGVLETSSGDLLVASVLGLTKIPAAVRRAAVPAPRVTLVDVLVDGHALLRERDLTLPYQRNRLELRFAAMSYRDPGRLRYQVRLGDDADWIDTRLPSFHFVDLPPGIYSAEARASLDGTAWTPQPARLAFVVLEPWYRTWWALASFGLAGLGLLYAIHRTRIAVLMRLERQRTRIAMDLHDELGSGLGSVGILAEIVRDGALDDRQRRGLGAEILEVTGELQAALSSIVWALRPGAGTLSALAAYLADRGRRAVPGDDEAFRCDYPGEWPAVTLSPAVRRNVQLIASEALANAVRHAGARRIVLGLAPEGRRWRLWVADDGRGLSITARRDMTSGVGLTSMRRRAEEIGGALAWSETPGGGTTVSVVFEPGARERSQAT